MNLKTLAVFIWIRILILIAAVAAFVLGLVSADDMRPIWFVLCGAFVIVWVIIFLRSRVVVRQILQSQEHPDGKPPTNY